MTHTDEARRIALKFYEEGNDFLIESLTIEIAAVLAAADAAAERRGIERAASALRKRADELSAADADGNCREIGTLVGAAILVSALLPAEPAAKCAMCGVQHPTHHSCTPAVDRPKCAHEMTDSPYRHCRKCGGT